MAVLRSGISRYMRPFFPHRSIQSNTNDPQNGMMCKSSVFSAETHLARFSTISSRDPLNQAELSYPLATPKLGARYEMLCTLRGESDDSSGNSDPASHPDDGILGLNRLCSEIDAADSAKQMLPLLGEVATVINTAVASPPDPTLNRFTSLLSATKQKCLKFENVEAVSALFQLLVSHGLPDPVFYETAIEKIMCAIKSSAATPAVILNLLYGLALGGRNGVVQLDVSALAVLARIIRNYTEMFSTESLVNAVESFGICSLRHEAIQESCRSIARRLIKGHAPKTNQTHLCRLSLPMLTRLLFSLAKCRVDFQPAFLEVTKQVRTRPSILDDLSPGDTTKLVYAFAKFHYRDVMFFNFIAQSARKNLAAFTMKDLAQFTASFSKSGTRSPVLMSRVCYLVKRTDISKGFNDVTGEDVVNLAVGLGSHLMRDKQLFARLSELLLESFVIEQGPTDQCVKLRGPANRLHGMSPEDLINIYYAWAKVGITDVKLFQRISRLLLQFVQQNQQVISKSCAIKYLHSCAKLRFRNYEFQRLVVETIIKPETDSLSPAEVLKISTSLQTFNMPDAAIEAQRIGAFPHEVTIPPPLPWRTIQRTSHPNGRRKNVRCRRLTW